jgi:hypothetical protein
VACSGTTLIQKTKPVRWEQQNKYIRISLEPLENFKRATLGRGESYLLVDIHNFFGTWEDQFKKLLYRSIGK